MGVDQIPGDCPLKIVQGDDLLLSFNIPFDISGYTWTVQAHHVNEGNINIPFNTQVQSSVLSIIQTNFYSSITSLLDRTENNKYHSWVMSYVDTNDLVRTLITGTIEVI
jgi:hypothetical protein